MQVIGNESRSSFVSNEADEITLILSPAATMTLDRYEAADSEKLVLFWDCCKALAYLHSQNILHRDIKPQNIGVCCSPLKAILLDLGCAIVASEHSDDMQGTVRYLAPEIIHIKEWNEAEGSLRKPPKPPASNKTAEIWSLGISFSELMLGLVPWSRVDEGGCCRRREELKLQEKELDTYGAFLVRQILEAVRWESCKRPDAASMKESTSSFLQRQNAAKRKHPYD